VSELRSHCALPIDTVAFTTPGRDEYLPSVGFGRKRDMLSSRSSTPDKKPTRIAMRSSKSFAIWMLHYRPSDMTSTSAGSPFLITAIARLSAGPSLLGLSIGPSL
jgi:hypothetical protein